MAAEVEPVQAVAEGEDVVAEAQRQVCCDEQAEVQQLGRVEGSLVVLVVPEYQLAVVVLVQVVAENGEYGHLHVVVLDDALGVDQHQLDEAEGRSQNIAPDRPDAGAVLADYPIQQQVPAPDDIVLADVDSQQRAQPHAPGTADLAVVEPHGHQCQAGRVGVVQEIEEVDSRTESQSQTACHIVQVMVTKLVYLHSEHQEQVPEQQAVDSPDSQQ